MKITEIFEDKDTLKLPDIKVGDEVKIGKWKNRKATVKGFKKDKKDNHPILKTTKGDAKLFKPRISKIEINELFDQPMELSWFNTTSGGKEAFFKVDDVRYKIAFGIGNKEDRIVGVSFGIYGKSHNYMTKSDNLSTESKHKTIQVFSTVMAAIDSYFKKENVDTMIFTASAGRQGAMYDRIAKYINSIHPEYHISQEYDEDNEEYYYEITK